MKILNFLLLITLLFAFTACEDKKSGQAQTEKNSTEVLTADEIAARKQHTYLLSDIHDQNRSIFAGHKYIEISNVKQKLILLNFFSTWCPPCKGQIPSLAALQKKYKKELFVAGILVNDKSDNASLQKFTKRYGVNYYLSNAAQNTFLAKEAIAQLELDDNYPLPLSILFKNGHYYSHYEGAVPIEMLEHDIQNANQ